MTTQIYGFMGFKGSGKDTAAKSLIDDSFVKVAFADTVKDVLATIFGWDRAMLDGLTDESRSLREIRDSWWSESLGFDISPRSAMTTIGTDLFRHHFCNDIWVLAAKKKVMDIVSSGKNVVVTDCRYPNEVDMVRNLGGSIVRIDRGNFPAFWPVTSSNTSEAEKREFMAENFHNVHESEWMWNHIKPDLILDNFFSSSESFSDYAYRELIKHSRP